jgi:hypothetical protein
MSQRTGMFLLSCSCITRLYSVRESANIGRTTGRGRRALDGVCRRALCDGGAAARHHRAGALSVPCLNVLSHSFWVPEYVLVALVAWVFQISPFHFHSMVLFRMLFSPHAPHFMRIVHHIPC